MKSKYSKLAALSCAAMLTFSGCVEHIDEGARFTFVGNTVATYLEEQEQCSHFVEILTRGEQIGLMKAYGQYTCFAPTNEAIEAFVAEQYNIWNESKNNPEKKEIWTGVVSPVWTELTDSMCEVISRNHIIPKMFLGVDFSGSSIPEANMNGRDLTLAFTDTTYAEAGVPLINSTAMVIEEKEVENGVVHIVDGVINPSSSRMAALLDEYTYFSVFLKMLEATGYADKLNEVEDKNYTEGDKTTKGIYTKQDAPYPAARKLGFTVFVEPNEVLAKYGITEDEESWYEYCRTIFPEGMEVWDWTGEQSAKIDFNNKDLTDWRNPVNQFIGYHILDRKLSYNYLVCYNIVEKNYGIEFKSEGDFPGTADRNEFYVTMNNRVLKVTMPRNSDSGNDFGKIFLNYAPVGNDGLGGQNVKVINPSEFEKGEGHDGFNPEALNGSLNVLDDILYYDENVMVGKVLNCIMRFDVSSICSELTNNRIRWKISSNLSSDAEVFIPHTYCDRVKVFADATRLFYLAPHTAWHNYQGDEMMALGLFDFAYRMPPVPAGTYEIRMGYSASTARHVVQVYLDDQVTGLPIDLRLTGASPMVNWKSDKDDLKNDEEQIAANDKDMKNRGYLKGPTTFYDHESGLARHNNLCLRAVIATKYLTAGSHWLRFKNVNDEDDGSAQFMHDYFEIVPISYLRDESVPVEDRRK